MKPPNHVGDQSCAFAALAWVAVLAPACDRKRVGDESQVPIGDPEAVSSQGLEL